MRQQRQKRPPNLQGVLQAIKNEKTEQGTVVQQPMDLFGAPDLGLTTKHQPQNSQDEQPINSFEKGSTTSPQQKKRRKDQKKKRNRDAKIEKLLKEGSINDINNFLKDNESIEKTIKQKLLKRVEDLNKERQTLRKQEAARRKKLQKQEATKREQQRKKQQIKKFINIIVNPNTKKQDVTNIFEKRLPLFQDIEHVDYIDDEKKRLYHQKLRQYHQKGFRDRIRRASGNVKMLTELKKEASDATKIEIQNLLENEKRKNTQKETNAKKREATRLLTRGSTKEIQQFIQDNESNEMLKQQIDKLNQKLETQNQKLETHNELMLLREKVTNANIETATQLLQTGSNQEIQRFIRDNESNTMLSDEILQLRTKLANVLLQTGSNQKIRKFIKDNESKANLSNDILLLKKKLADALLQTGSNEEIQPFIQKNESNDNLSEQIQKLRKAIIKNNYKTHISNFKEAGSHQNIQAIYANTVGNNQIEPSDRIEGIQNQIQLTYDIFRLSKEFNKTQDENTKEELYNQMFGMVLYHGMDPSEITLLFNNAMMLNNENFSNFVEYFVQNFKNISEKKEIGVIHGIDPRALHAMNPGTLRVMALQKNEELKNQYEFIYRTTQYKTLAEAAVNAGEFVRHKALRNNLINLLPFIEDRQLYQNFLDIFQRMIRSKEGFIDLALKDINPIERRLIMNGIFPLYLTRVEKVEGEDITDIINTYEIENTDKRKEDILSFINDKYYPNTLYKF